jgi:hypothetical protein
MLKKQVSVMKVKSGLPKFDLEERLCYEDSEVKSREAKCV